MHVAILIPWHHQSVRICQNKKLYTCTCTILLQLVEVLLSNCTVRYEAETPAIWKQNSCTSTSRAEMEYSGVLVQEQRIRHAGSSRTARETREWKDESQTWWQNRCHESKNVPKTKDFLQEFIYIYYRQIIQHSVETKMNRGVTVNYFAFRYDNNHSYTPSLTGDWFIISSAT